jgi:photosystem II stability/assembly factor-like uncharacterized protein
VGRRSIGVLGVAAILAGTTTGCRSAGTGPPERAAAAISPSPVGSLAGGTHSRKLSGFRLLDLSFVNPRDGYALGRFFGTDAQPVDPAVMALMRTSNGGVSWKTVGSPPAAAGHIQFSSPRLGWAFGPKLLVTTDGGTSWVEEHPGGRVEDLAPAGRSVWSVIGACAGGCAFHIRVSADAGRTWRRPQPPLSIPGEHVEMARIGSVGWAVSSTANPEGGVALVRTADGGETWAGGDDPCDQRINFGAEGSGRVVFESHPAPIDERRLWLLCTDEPVGGSSHGAVFTTVDGGGTWRPAFMGPSGNELHVAALTPGTGWETDGTTTYCLARLSVTRGIHRAPAALCGGPGWADLEFLDSRHGWAADGRYVFRTTDGGQRWLRVLVRPAACGCIHRVDGR